VTQLHFLVSWSLALAATLSFAAAAAAPNPLYDGIGRPATPKEIAAWDIDVRPDFKGLPKGSGSVAAGQDIWEARCAACHGIFGESNEFFSPLIGGTTAADLKSGHAAKLLDRGFPARTTLMKVASVSTLWDYINRAMPWNAPKSLKTDEVYAVLAFLLNLGGVVGDDFVLSDQTIAQAQARMPNRNGMTTAHALWPGAGFGKSAPDVRAVACMSNCEAEPKLASVLPDYARNAHGNLAEQNRLVGAQHGADTSRAASAAAAAAPTTSATTSAAPPAATATAVSAGAAAVALLKKHGCIVCHAVETRLIGPPLREVARKHGTRADAVAYLSAKIRSGGAGVWGAIPMPPQTLAEADARAIAQWLADGAKP
jgi:cytochrome c